MALTGTLKDFGIAEILQLIGTQKKTGVLTLEDDHNKAEIDFSDGMVVGARGGALGVTIEQRFLRSGLISHEQKTLADRKVKETLKPFTAVLLSEEMVTLKVIHETLAMHISEIVYETFSWKTGTYAFEQKFIQWDNKLIAPMSAESIMMDGLRIVDESPPILKAIPSLKARYVSQHKAAGSGTSFGPAAEAILSLLDGKRTVLDVILATRMPRFDVLKLMAKLLSQELIAPVQGEPGEEQIIEKDDRKVGIATKAIIYFLIVVVAFVTALELRNNLRKTSLPYLSVEEQGKTTGLLKSIELVRVRNALEIYFLKTGTYPESLEALVKTGLITENDLSYIANFTYSYNPNENSYKMEKNKKPGKEAQSENLEGQGEESRR